MEFDLSLPLIFSLLCNPERLVAIYTTMWSLRFRSLFPLWVGLDRFILVEIGVDVRGRVDLAKMTWRLG